MESDHPSPLGCASGFSQHPDLAVAVGEVVGAILEGIEPHAAVAMLFVAGQAADRFEEVAGAIRSLLAPEILIATSTSGLFGGTQEVPAPTGITLLAANIEGCIPLRFEDDGPDAAKDQLANAAPTGTVAVLLGGEGFRFPRLTSSLAEVAPQIDVVGGGTRAGFATAATPSPVRLLLGDQFYNDGAVGLLLPPGAASTCELGAVMWDDAGDQVPIVGPVEVADAAGLVLFAEDRVGLLDGPTLEFDLVFEYMDGALVGMSGESFLYPLDRSAETAGAALRSSVVKPRATALVIKKPT